MCNSSSLRAKIVTQHKGLRVTHWLWAQNVKWKKLLHVTNTRSNFVCVVFCTTARAAIHGTQHRIWITVNFLKNLNMGIQCTKKKLWSQETWHELSLPQSFCIHNQKLEHLHSYQRSFWIYYYVRLVLYDIRDFWDPWSVQRSVFTERMACYTVHACRTQSNHEICVLWYVTLQGLV